MNTDEKELWGEMFLGQDFPPNGHPVKIAVSEKIDGWMVDGDGLLLGVKGFHRGLCNIVREPEFNLVLLGEALGQAGQMEADDLLQKFKREGLGALLGYDGSHLILLHKVKAREVHFITGRINYHKVYYIIKGDSLFFSTRLDGIGRMLAGDADIDYFSMAQFLTCDHLLNDRSLLKGVRVLPSASIMEVGRKGIQQWRHWTPEISGDSTGSTEMELIDHLWDILADSYKRSLKPGKVVFPLSGGLDSRFLAATFPLQKRPDIRAVTFGPAYCNDVTRGKKIAKKLALNHRVVSLPKDYYRRYLPLAFELADGEISLEALPMFRLLDIGMEGAQLVSGYLGDILSGGHLPTLEGMRSEEDKLKCIWNRHYVKMGCSESHLKELLQPMIYREVKGRCYELFRENMANANAERIEDKATLVELTMRQNRYISYHLLALSSQYRIVAPFTDQKVLGFFLGLPLELRRNQQLYRKSFFLKSPELARVPVGKEKRNFQKYFGVGTKSESLFSSLPLPLRWRVNKINKYWGDRLADWTRGRLGNVIRHHYVSLAEDIRKDPQWFEMQLLDDPKLDEWFQRETVKRWLQEHRDHKKDHSMRLANILCLLEWRRRFIGE